MATKTLNIDINGDSSGARRAFKNVEGDADRFTGTLKSKFSSAGALLGGAVLGGLAAAGIGMAVRGIFTEAAEAAKVGRLTDAVLKSTGEVAKVSAGQIGELSSALSLKSGIDDEVIQSGANVLLTFTKVRNELGAGNDIFNQGATVALDMAAALGEDLQPNIIRVGKALNDPVKGVAMLGKAGVQFSEDQKAMIQSLVDSGDLLGAQKIILGELQTQFGGAAEAAASPIDRLKVAFSNLQESVGLGLLPAVSQVVPQLQIALAAIGPALGTTVGGLVAALSPIVSALAPVFVALGSGLATIFAALTPVLTTFASTVGPILADLLSTLGGALAPVLASFGNLVATLAPLLAPLARVLGVVAKAASALLVPVLDALAAVLKPIIDALLPPLTEALNILGPIISQVAASVGDKLGAALVQLTPALVEVAQILGESFIQNLEAIAPTLPALAESFTEMAVAITPLVVAVLPLLAKAIAELTPLFTMTIVSTLQLATTITTAITGAVDWVIGALRWLKTNWDLVWLSLKETLSGAWNGIVSTFASIPGRIADALSGVTGAILAPFKNGLNEIIRLYNDFQIPGFGVGPFKTPDINTPNVPYLHSGGIFDAKGGEGLAMLKSGEGVFTPDQMSALGGGGTTNLTVIVQSGEVISEAGFVEMVRSGMIKAARTTPGTYLPVSTG